MVILKQYGGTTRHFIIYIYSIDTQGYGRESMKQFLPSSLAVEDYDEEENLNDDINYNS
jgi:hypothetical protein